MKYVLHFQYHFRYMVDYYYRLLVNFSLSYTCNSFHNGPLDPQNLTLVKCLPQVGEAFRALVHVNWVRASYGVASLYVLADTRDKAVKMMKRTDGAADETEKKKKVAAAAFDTLLWQVGLMERHIRHCSH
jgi:hypothetical protein